MPEQVGDLQEKACHSAKLKQTLAFEESPVAVAILPQPPDGLRRWRRKATPCVMLQSARRGSASYCPGVIAGLIATGKIGVSFLDMTCRIFSRYRDEEMVVGVPAERLSRIVNSIDRSIAGWL